MEKKMKDKSTTTYWLMGPNIDDDSAIDIITTPTSRVPRPNEVINLNTTVDIEEMHRRFPHIKKEQLIKMVAPLEKQVRGEFIVMKVSRHIETYYYEEEASSLLGSFLGAATTAGPSPKNPASYNIEVFEVYLQNF